MKYLLAGKNKAAKEYIERANKSYKNLGFFNEILPEREVVYFSDKRGGWVLIGLSEDKNWNFARWINLNDDPDFTIVKVEIGLGGAILDNRNILSATI